VIGSSRRRTASQVTPVPPFCWGPCNEHADGASAVCPDADGSGFDTATLRRPRIPLTFRSTGRANDVTAEEGDNVTT